MGLKVHRLCSVPSAKGTPSSKSLRITAAKSLKKSSSSLAYLSTHCRKLLSVTRAMSVGSIIRVLVVLSSYYWGVSHRLPVRGGKDTYLLGTVPLLPVPLLVHEELEELVGQDSGRECPWALEATSVTVASSEGVSTAQGNDLLVVEAHTVEDVAQVLVSLGCIWETSIRCASRHILVSSTRSVWDDGAVHLLDGADTTENPKVGVGDPRELFCKLLARVFTRSR